MAYVFINVGSNLGQRRLNLSRAMKGVGERFGNFEMSHVVESEPWGFDSTHSFLNVGLQFESDLPPEEILRQLHELEREISDAPHRNADGSYRDRAVDIDIVAIDREVIDTPELKVPHPELANRRFFLEPMEEMAPGWQHPITGLTPGEMLEALICQK